MTRASSWIAALVLAAAGFAVWAAFSLPMMTGRPAIREAWDSDSYWTFGLPVLLALVLAAGFAARLSPAILAAFAVGGHFLGIVLIAKPGTDLSLLPLSAAFIGVPMFIVALGVAWIGRWVREAVE